MVDLVDPGAGVSRDDVLTAYDMFLERRPEDESAISWHMQFPNRRALAVHMLGSEEYRLRTPPAPEND